MQSFESDEANTKPQDVREITETVEVDEEEQETEEELIDENEGQTQLRRSTRVSSKPAYLDDYVLLAEAEGERLLMVLNDEQRSMRFG